MSGVLRGQYDEDVEIPEDAYVPMQDFEFALAGLTTDQRAAVLAHVNAPYCGYGCGHDDPGCRCGDDS